MISATPAPWRMQDGLLAATLKLRRREILKRFAPEVDALYT